MVILNGKSSSEARQNILACHAYLRRGKDWRTKSATSFWGPTGIGCQITYLSLSLLHTSNAPVLVPNVHSFPPMCSAVWLFIGGSPIETTTNVESTTLLRDEIKPFYAAYSDVVVTETGKCCLLHRLLKNCRCQGMVTTDYKLKITSLTTFCYWTNIKVCYFQKNRHGIS